MSAPAPLINPLINKVRSKSATPLMPITAPTTSISLTKPSLKSGKSTSNVESTPARNSATNA